MTIDATCPLVTKVHREALKFAAEGYTIVLIGHAGHEEVEGTMGEAPDHIVLVESEADVDTLEVADERKLAYISQTTLSVDETRTIIARLRERFPHITGPRTDDICYATTNRQAAVRQMAAAVRPRARDRLQELVELEPAGRRRPRPRRRVLPDRRRRSGPGGVARGRPRRRHLLRRVSAPEELVESLVDFFRDRGTTDVSEFEVLREDVRFMLPKQIRQAMTAAADA